MKILIAPWGKPAQWEETEYRHNNESEVSKSSLTLLVRKLEPSKIIIIVLDTLGRGDKGNSYEALCEEVRENIQKFINTDLKIQKEVEIVVAPGVGEFTEKIDQKNTDFQLRTKFDGNMRDYYSFILYALSTLLINNKNEKEIEIHLDLTHGINFMPVLTYMALKEISGVLAIRKTVKFCVYNSDPFQKGVKNLNINKVDERDIETSPCREIIENSTLRLLQLTESSSDSEKREFYRSLQDKEIRADEINAFLSSVANGLPLVLFCFFPEIELLREEVENCINKFKESIKINKNNGLLEVKRDCCFTPHFEVLTKAYLTAKIIGIERKREIYLEELEKVKEKVFGKNYALKNNIDKELGERGVKQYDKCIREEWEPYSEIIKRARPQEMKKMPQTDFRNFLAHAGLEKNAVELRKKEGKIMVRYNDNLIKNIIDYSGRALRFE